MAETINLIPEKIANYNLYNGSDKQVGITGEVKLPAFDFMTETISGAGILGEYESANIGHTGSIEVEIPYRTVTNQTLELIKNQYSTIFLRAAEQQNDVSGGGITTKSVKITFKGLPKNVDLGKVDVGKTMEASAKLEVIYFKYEVDGNILLEYDKLNMIYVVNGEDQLRAIRSMI